MAIIRQLKNFFTKQVIYPKTLTKAVYDENGERLDKILRDTMLATDNEEYSGVEPRDADTLGGKYTKEDVEKIIEENNELRNSLDKLNSNLKNKQSHYIQSEITGTTDIYGNLLVAESNNNALVVSVSCGSYMAIPFVYGDGNTYAHITDMNENPIKNTKLTVKGWYFTLND